VLFRGNQPQVAIWQQLIVSQAGEHADHLHPSQLFHCPAHEVLVTWTCNPVEHHAADIGVRLQGHTPFDHGGHGAGRLGRVHH
jgi:hypothetical protein